MADDVPLREKAPVVTVEGLVAVVAQHEDAARWHRQRRQLVRRPLVDIALVLQLPVHVEPAAAHLGRARRSRSRLAAASFNAARHAPWRCLGGVSEASRRRLGVCVSHLDCVAAHGDDALDERLAVALLQV